MKYIYKNLVITMCQVNCNHQ